MFEKAGKFYADWRDRDGVRRRKSFTSPRAAQRFEAEQKELAHPKPKARVTPSPSYSRPISKTGDAPIARTSKSPRPSSLRLVHSRRRASAPRTSKK
jgi:hypothetical protein